MRIHHFITARALLALGLLLSAASLAKADVSTLDPVKPFFADTTLFVVHVDVTKLDLKALDGQVRAALDKNPAMDAARKKACNDTLDALMKQANKAITDFQTCGGHDFYLILDLAGEEPHMLVPLTDKSDKAGLRSLLTTGDSKSPPPPADAAPNPDADNFVEIKGMLVMGNKTWLDKMSSNTPVDRPDLAEAFAASDGVIRFAMAPSDTIRAMIGGMGETLPPVLGGGPTTDITQGFKWMSAGALSSTSPGAHLTIQAADAGAAQKLLTIIHSAFNSALMEETRNPNRGSGMQDLLALLEPTVKGAQLKLDWDASGLSRLLASAVPSMIEARAAAVRVRSASNIRQLMMGVLMYANDHNGDCPRTLDETKEFFGDDKAFAKLINDPDSPQAKPLYAYVPPFEGKVNKIANSDRRLVIYEIFQTWDKGVNVGFADGSVEFIKDKAQFDQLIKDAKGGQ